MSNGIRWLRHLLIPIVLGFLVNAFQVHETWQRDIFFFLVVGIIYFLMYVSHRIRFDDENFIIIRGKRERTISFTAIDSIKRSGRKLNNRKFWYLEYRDKDDLPHRYYFLKGNFQHGAAKELIKKVQLVNPSLWILGHNGYMAKIQYLVI